MPSNTQDEIHRLSSRRQEIWSGASEIVPEEVKRIAAKLTDLYEQLRIERSAAESRGRSRDEIVRQARTETELERLATQR